MSVTMPHVEAMKTFNEIMTGPNPLTDEEIVALHQKRPVKYGWLEKWAEDATARIAAKN